MRSVELPTDIRKSMVTERLESPTKGRNVHFRDFLRVGRLRGLENLALFALQKASKIDRFSPLAIALEICNFLIRWCFAFPTIKINLTGSSALIRHLSCIHISLARIETLHVWTGDDRISMNYAVPGYDVS
jgi:hypothetical protein